jgi:hypothetical protein
MISDEQIWDSLIQGYTLYKEGKDDNNETYRQALKHGPAGFIAYVLGVELGKQNLNPEKEEHPEFKKDIIEHIREQL